MKRLLDLLASSLGLICSLPMFLTVAILVKLDSPGPVFYRGVRVGKGSKPFRIFKFRTMVLNADRLGASSAADDDPRLTRAGKLLRRCKLDELPQLLNVWLGHMSLVGPRPQVQWAVDLYSDQERQLLAVRPGITDYASIRFRNEGEILRGSADPDTDYLEKIAPEKIRLGLEYVRHHSLWVDTRIVVATIWAVLGGNPDHILGWFSRSGPMPGAAEAREVG